MTEFNCGNCNGEFDEPIPINNQHGIEKHVCPFCDEAMSERFTQEKNIENCVHSPTVDGVDEHGNEYEICSSCGCKWNINRGTRTRDGVKEAWNPAGGRI